MNQHQRDRRAIRQVLDRVGEAGLQDMLLAAGEGLTPALRSMIEDGSVHEVRTGRYRLADHPGT